MKKFEDYMIEKLGKYTFYANYPREYTEDERVNFITEWRTSEIKRINKNTTIFFTILIAIYLMSLIGIFIFKNVDKLL